MSVEDDAWPISACALIPQRRMLRLRRHATLAAARRVAASSRAAVSLVPDPTLVDFPPEAAAVAGGVAVYRSVVTADDEDTMHAELVDVLEKRGDKIYHAARVGVHAATTMLLHGWEPVKKARDMERQGRPVDLLGLVWSETLAAFVRGPAAALLGVEPTSARVTEYHAPGEDMAVAAPALGSSFLYLNLLGPCVLQFDDEARRLTGRVFVPDRSLLKVSGEARWGWRFGQDASPAAQTWRGRRLEPTYRVGITLFRLSEGLLDKTETEATVDSTVAAERRRLLAARQANPGAASGAVVDSDTASVPGSAAPPLPPGALAAAETDGDFLARLAEKSVADAAAGAGPGVLGGEIAGPSQPAPSRPGAPTGALDPRKFFPTGVATTAAEAMAHKESLQQRLDQLQEMQKIIGRGDLTPDKVEQIKAIVGDREFEEMMAADANTIHSAMSDACDQAESLAERFRAMDYDGKAAAFARGLKQTVAAEAAGDDPNSYQQAYLNALQRLSHAPKTPLKPADAAAGPRIVVPPPPQRSTPA